MGNLYQPATEEVNNETEGVRQFQGMWIPKEIWLNQNLKDLTWTERILLLEIHSLEGETGCWASNAHFAKILMMGVSGVKKVLSKLYKKGYAYIDRYEKCSNGNKRFLKTKITDTTTKSSNLPQNPPVPKGGATTGDTPGRQLGPHSNTFSNTKSIYNTKSSVKSTLECVSESLKTLKPLQAVRKEERTTLQTKEPVIKSCSPQLRDNVEQVDRVCGESSYQHDLEEQREKVPQKRESSAKERKVETGLTVTQCVWEYYKRVRGIDENDGMADTFDFPRYKRSIRTILQYAQGDRVKAFQAIEWVKNWSEYHGLTKEQWNLSTVAKKLYDFHASNECPSLTYLGRDEKIALGVPCYA